MSDSSYKRAVIAAIITNVIFGFSYVFSRKALDCAPPHMLLAVRFILAFIAVNIIVLVTRAVPACPEWLQFSLKGKKLLPILIMAVLEPVGYFLFENYGISLSNATTGGVIIATVPVAGIMAGVIFLKERITPLQIVFSLISLVGVIMNLNVGASLGAADPIGIFLLFGAVVTAAAFAVISRNLSTDFTPLERTYVMMGVGAIFFTLMALAKGVDPSALQSTGFTVAVLYLSLLSSITAFLLMNYTYTCLPVSRAMVFGNLSTVISLYAGVLFLGEPMTIISAIGSVLIIIGVFGVQKCAQ